eukprot:7799585-Alexandrium_andersonii.AAC.1
MRPGAATSWGAWGSCRTIGKAMGKPTHAMCSGGAVAACRMGALWACTLGAPRLKIASATAEIGSVMFALPRAYVRACEP